MIDEHAEPMMDPMVPEPTGEPTKMIAREVPTPDPGVAASVKRWCDRVKAAKKFHEEAFKRMRDDMQFAVLGYDSKEWTEGDYSVNIVQRVIGQAVASMYARTPKALAKRRPRLDYVYWDGDPATIQAAMQAAMPPVDPMTGQPMLDPRTGMPAQGDPMALQILQEVQQVKQQRMMLDRQAKTLEILFNYFITEQEPNFKAQLKQMVRRTKVCGVGYTKVGFQRIMERRADITARIADFTDQLQRVETLSADLADGEIQADSADAQDLRDAIAALQEAETVIVREGVVFDFPRSPAVIPDPRTRQLKGWVGTGWIAEEIPMHPAEVKDRFKIDIGKDYTSYEPEQRERMIDPVVEGEGEQAVKGLACVWRIQDKATGTTFVVCDGYPDYLQPPAAPDVKIEQFFDLFPLTFNDIESEKEVFPRSDVHLVRHPQKEYNRARQGLREQRHANRPAYVSPSGTLEDTDKAALASHPANAVIELRGLQPGQDVKQLLQRVPTAPIDPAQYDVNPQFEDTLRVVGSSESNSFGSAGNDVTATGESIAENSRSLAQSANVDDLDEHLSAIARAAGQIMLLEMSEESVKEIVGPGAVWPNFSREQIAKELFLEVKAGSSGRPNQAAELAKRERAMPFLMQMPNINPTPIARDYLELLDIDVEDAIVEGLPSVIAMNAMAGRQATQANAPPGENPGDQGDQGGNNAPRGQQDQPGPQPAYPAPA